MLKGKKGIIFGIANDHSIAWGIGKKLSEHGAQLAITYQNENLLKRVKPLANELATNNIANIIFAIVFLVFAISFFGYFEIRVPNSLLN